MKAGKKAMKVRKINKHAMGKIRGGSTVSGLVFSSFSTTKNPEPKHGPLQSSV